jgi:hypothetical protein
VAEKKHFSYQLGSSAFIACDIPGTTKNLEAVLVKENIHCFLHKKG